MDNLDRLKVLFLNALAESKNVQEILEIYHTETGADAVILSLTGQVIAAEGLERLPDHWKDTVMKHGIDPEAMMEYLSEKKSLTHQVGPIGPGAEESKRPFFELPLRQRNRVIGYTYLFPDTPESGEDLQPSAELLNRVIACALSFEPVITPKELGKMLLEQEIFEYPERPAALPDNPQEIGMESISPDYLAAVIHLGKAKPEGQIALFQKLRASVPYCFNYLEQDWIWLLFCEVDVSRKKERFLSEMGVQKGEEILSCGISDTFSGMEQRGTYFQQAQKAAMVGELLGMDLAVYSDIYPDIVYYDAARAEGSYLLPELKELISCDSQGQSEYYETLKFYLFNGSDLSQTAAHFGIHRNSAAYRLRKIEDLLHADLKDPSTSRRLTVGIRSFEIAEKLSGQKKQ